MIDFIPTNIISDSSLTQETRDRIIRVENRLKEAGYTSIRFSWNFEQMAKDLPTLDAVANVVCQTLEDDLDGKLTEVPILDDIIDRIIRRADVKCDETRRSFDKILVETVVRECVEVASRNFHVSGYELGQVLLNYFGLKDE